VPRFEEGSRSLPVYRRLSRGQAEDIPDIYWEQAARELDFCTCRKCQVVGAYLLAAKELDFCICRMYQVVGAFL
jgi:hypothetical protein